MQIFGRVLVCRSMQLASQYARSDGFDGITLDGDKVPAPFSALAPSPASPPPPPPPQRFLCSFRYLFPPSLFPPFFSWFSL